MAHLYEWPLLTKEQEQHLFRKMNFLKHKLHKLQETLDPTRARVADLMQVEELQEEINGVPRPCSSTATSGWCTPRPSSTSAPARTSTTS